MGEFVDFMVVVVVDVYYGIEQFYVGYVDYVFVVVVC